MERLWREEGDEGEMRIVRFRLGERVREGLYWGRVEDSLCKVCGEKGEM